MHRNRSVMSHNFSMIPKADIPRSVFDRPHGFKTTFDAGYLVPVFLDEVLPGDTLNLKMTAFCRMTTPIYPIMDNLFCDSFFFFVPLRLVWSNFQKFMGEQANPGDSTSYVIPQQVSPAVTGYAVNSLQDYMGLPTGVPGLSHSALFTRAYNLIYNEWFKDQNLQNAVTVDKGDGPDNVANYVLLRRGKRHDYFTSCLPWPQKGTAVSIPLGATAPVTVSNIAAAADQVFARRPVNASTTYDASFNVQSTAGSPVQAYAVWPGGANAGIGQGLGLRVATGTLTSTGTADLSTATAATINSLRQAFQFQKLLERDARGGTRYTEIIQAHFSVRSPDARLQRPEYLGGGTTMVNISEIQQTSGSGASGTTAPLGTLAAKGTLLAQGHGFSQSFTEHGIIIGLVNVRADLNYQQGLARMWSRSTKNDFYWPAFAQLGEQAVLNKEIYAQGTANPTADAAVFGYQERWAEYRYKNSLITGQFRSTYAQTLDGWHLAQKFTALPTLNSTFIVENPPMERILAVGAAANGSHFYGDFFFSYRCARPMPMYSVPGLIDHF